jgi:hypothetical protein
MHVKVQTATPCTRMQTVSMKYFLDYRDFTGTYEIASIYLLDFRKLESTSSDPCAYFVCKSSRTVI